MRRWLNQFDAGERDGVVALLDHVIFISENDLRHGLARHNEILLRRLAASGIAPTHVIYVQMADAGSSSGSVLRMLRDDCNLQLRGCKLIDGTNAIELGRLTKALGRGAIIYVDDFSGTGNQLARARSALAPAITGVFSEWFLVGCACEEAIHRLGRDGVEPITPKVHTRAERPLHTFGSGLDDAAKAALLRLSETISGGKGHGLGYQRMATMVVLEWNTPNTVPMILRGNEGQVPYVGIFPRTTDREQPPAL